jgi:hypothetical protein
MFTRIFAAAMFALLTVTTPARAATMVIDFTASVHSIEAVSNAGTTIFGHITLDPNTALLQYAGPGYAGYSFSGPATFTMTTDGGFSLTQNLTGFNVRDASAGGGEYYVFDADVGTFWPDHIFAS